MSSPKKFRIWDKVCKRYLSYVDMSLMSVPGYEFEQWTGLLDKNDKEIYEGDIIRLRGRDASEKDIYQVQWHPREVGFVFFRPDRNTFFRNNDNWYASYEIIGNIHDN